MEDEEPKRISSYRDLRIYQRSYEAALEIHRITPKFPGFERSELGSQLRRAATSIPINIAEGYGRKRSPEDFKRFLVIALGSCDESASCWISFTTSNTSTAIYTPNGNRSTQKSAKESTS